MSYRHPASGLEVDFIVTDLAVVIEAKATTRITADHLKGIRDLKNDHGTVGRAVVICLEPGARRTDDGIDILPVETFCKMLWAGELFQ